jgi:hypothetical protein
MEKPRRLAAGCSGGMAAKEATRACDSGSPLSVLAARDHRPRQVLLVQVDLDVVGHDLRVLGRALVEQLGVRAADRTQLDRLGHAGVIVRTGLDHEQSRLDVFDVEQGLGAPDESPTN